MPSSGTRGRSPCLGQAEAGLPVAALAQVEEPADDALGLLEQRAQAVSQLLVAVLEAAVHGPELGDGCAVQEPVVRQPSQQGLEFLCGQGHRAEPRASGADPEGAGRRPPPKPSRPFRAIECRRSLPLRSPGPFIYFLIALLRNNEHFINYYSGFFLISPVLNMLLNFETVLSPSKGPEGLLMPVALGHISSPLRTPS